MDLSLPLIKVAVVALCIAVTAGRVVVQPYCDGSSILTTAALYEEPPCSRSVEQTPSYDDALSYESYELSNLSFCCKSNYTTILPTGADVQQVDAEAQHLMSFVDTFLSRYDCSQFYPFQTCEHCRRAYRTWLCATMFPMKCLGSRPASLRTCEEVCLEVQRKCPPEMHFFCPLDDNTKDDGDGQYAPWHGGSENTLFGRGGCNPAHYNLGPGSPYSASPSASLAAVALAAISLLVV
jgi:hypothetical protein